ncbi:MAG: Zn-ribbon domain-containing OB-fold protein [Acidimicrobiia bacterium]
MSGGPAADLRPQPSPNDTNRFYWDAAREHRLVLQKCRSCGLFQYPPDVACVHCQSQDAVPTQVSGRGTVYSYATVDRLFHVGFTDHLPYVVVLVELEEQPGLLMLTNLIDAGPDGAQVGMAVEVAFDDRGDVTIPQFRPARSAS